MLVTGGSWRVLAPANVASEAVGGFMFSFLGYAQTVEGLVSGPVLALGMVLGWDKLSVFVRSTHGADSGCECWWRAVVRWPSAVRWCVGSGRWVR